MDLIRYLPQVVRYLDRAGLESVPGWQNKASFQVSALAQGEYNMNYRISQGQNSWVLRVNLGTQIGRADQIAYEFKALKLLEESGITPRPYYLDDSRTLMDYGMLIMEYLPGETLDYQRDLDAAARLFGRLHSLEISQENNHLIMECFPLRGMYDECIRLVDVYLKSELANPELCRYLSDVFAWAEMALSNEAFFLSDPCFRVINTEVNSGNFIFNRDCDRLYLVDWEKPLWGDPSQDLSHFSVPTTTLWKTNYRMSESDRRSFIREYRDAVSDPHLSDTILDRVRLRDPYNCLRGISWSAMAWVAYQTGEHSLKNADTFQKIQAYLEPSFVRSLFDPYMK